MPTMTLTNTTTLGINIEDLPGGVRVIGPLGTLAILFVNNFDPDQPLVPTRRDIYEAPRLRKLLEDGILTSAISGEFDTEGEVIGAGDPVGGFGVNASSFTGTFNNRSAVYTLDDANGTTGTGLGAPRVVECYLSDSGMGIGLTAGVGLSDVAIASPATLLTELVTDKLFLACIPAGGAAPHFKLDVTGTGLTSATFWAVLVDPDTKALHIQAVVLTPSGD